MMTRRQWMTVVMVGAAMVALPMVMRTATPTSDEARASIVCPADLTATTGTINSIRIFGDDGRTGRHHGVIINGTVTAGGAFECTIPYINGQARFIYVKEVAANPMGTAVVNIDSVFDSNASLPAITAGQTMSSGSAFLSAGADTANPTATNCQLLMGAVKLTISSATAGGKFTAVLVCRVTG